MGHECPMWSIDENGVHPRGLGLRNVPGVTEAGIRINSRFETPESKRASYRFWAHPGNFCLPPVSQHLIEALLRVMVKTKMMRDEEGQTHEDLHQTKGGFFVFIFVLSSTDKAVQFSDASFTWDRDLEPTIKK